MNVLEQARTLWTEVGAGDAAQVMTGVLHRLVENQQQIATRSLVGGDLQKQEVLEQLLEKSKPSAVIGTEHLDYLLATPWRYPPLRHGSRYGHVTESSLFYGAIGVQTTLAESAYYRWFFYFDMDTPINTMASQHTLFEAKYKFKKGIALHSDAFDSVHTELTHRSDYRFTQELGASMRADGIDGFEYPSARDPEGGNNVGLFVPKSLASSKAQNQRGCFCTTDKNNVIFRVTSDINAVYTFSIEQFMEESYFPRPAG